MPDGVGTADPTRHINRNYRAAFAHPTRDLVRQKHAVVGNKRMRNLIAAATAAAATLIASQIAFGAGAQECLRPKWTECISFPHGGRHTGVNAYGMTIETAVPPGAEICVSTEWEINADTYAMFERGGMPWPNRDWEVRVETFCFYRND
jgi:hypothetical protein